MLLTKTNDAIVNSALTELHYVANVEQGKITLKRINDAQNTSEWNDAINSGMQPSNNQRSGMVDIR